ncbi:uncharacterized protein A4U43_C03F8020 [Asparagus officinalis]|uniref:Uncharacterized protein n=1 Tax=Asparagus officinalis TaxID=4686 RepID=A0A5P1FB06_ASPOF|nr:uncharacterized protein A4U43_C03F8020 [Asparagus officinalis]
MGSRDQQVESSGGFFSAIKSWGSAMQKSRSLEEDVAAHTTGDFRKVLQYVHDYSLPIYSTLKPPEWQIAFGPVFKCNSTVWRALMMVNPAKEKNQWMVEIDKFTVEVPRVAVI